MCRVLCTMALPMCQSAISNWTWHKFPAPNSFNTLIWIYFIVPYSRRSATIYLVVHIILLVQTIWRTSRSLKSATWTRSLTLGVELIHYSPSDDKIGRLATHVVVDRLRRRSTSKLSLGYHRAKPGVLKRTRTIFRLLAVSKAFAKGGITSCAKLLNASRLAPEVYVFRIVSRIEWRQILQNRPSPVNYNYGSFPQRE